MIELEALNTVASADFVTALGAVFEHSPWVPERVAAQRPFSSVSALHRSLCEAVMHAPADEQLALIRAHPELAGRAAIRGDLTADSAREQQGAGLAACTPDEYSRLHALNAEYRSRFGFPFVLAVKGHTRASVIAALAERVTHEATTERSVALHEICRIARFRLADLVAEPLGVAIIGMAEELARLSETAGSLTCTYMTAAHRATAAMIRDFMLGAGLAVHIDAVGNVVGVLAGEGLADRGFASDSRASDSLARQSSASDGLESGSGARNGDERRSRRLLTGSHYDTVIDGGKFDGRLGVLLPIAVAGRLRRAGVRLPYPLEIIAFAEEEGVRFKSTFLGSRAVAGRFDPGLLDVTDPDGVPLRDAITAAGHDVTRIPAIARDPAEILCFVEVHIEQGPVLLDADLPLGVVTSIAGSIRSLVTVRGLSGHAGTVPMALRHDAAAAAAEIVLAVERRCRSEPGLVGTVGKLDVPGGAVNVIAGRCDLSIDLRAGDDEVRDAADVDLRKTLAGIATRRGVSVEVRRVLETQSVPCAPALQDAWAASIERITGGRAPRLPSGAGHDAMMMASLTDIGMLFVRCGNGGISHHPSEALSIMDADLAAHVFEDFLRHFKASH
jgi:allantoate deiminase/N-carbamoyl-L-amino-acid hydrolase